MSIFYPLFRLLAVILTFSALQGSYAEPPLPTCSLQEKSCGSFSSNPTYRCIEKRSQCCNPKSPYYKECCEGLLVYSYDASNCAGAYWPYIPGDSSCCDGNPYSKSWQGCCEGRTYFSKYDTCCEGRIVLREACCNNKRIDPETTGCCAGKPYNYKTQACCDDKVICASSILLLKPKGCKGCIKRDPSCFYATVEGSNEVFFAQAAIDDRAMIILPKALCPDKKVEICMHPRCGTSPEITGSPKDGYILEGVCCW